MLRKSFFTLPAESLKKKYGSEALLGHATRYHDDVNLKHTILINRDNAMTTSHPCQTFSFEDTPPPYISKQKNGRPRPNIPKPRYRVLAFSNKQIYYWPYFDFI